jgi:hypothetical protein
MKNIFAGRAIAALGLAVPMLLAGPAHADTGTGDVQFVYDPPQIAEDGSHVTWHWTLTNHGSEPASQVTLLHRLTPSLDSVKASAPCTVAPKVIRCHYDTVAAGATEEGTVDADLPSDLSGTVQINGRITWQSGAKPPAAHSAPEGSAG